ncbi:hypothetical protein STENM223S_06002 [Streptomyces tendae]
MKLSSLVTSSSKEERSSAASSGSVCRPAVLERSQRASRRSLRARARFTGAVPPRAVRRTRSRSSASSSSRRPKATTRRRVGGPAAGPGESAVVHVGQGELPGSGGTGSRAPRPDPSSRAPRAAFRSTFSMRYDPFARATAGESYRVASTPSTREPMARMATLPSSPREGRTPSVYATSRGVGETIRMPPAYRRRSW